MSYQGSYPPPVPLTTSQIATGAVGVSNINATGTPSSSTFFRGDGTWSSVPAFMTWQTVQTSNFVAAAGNAYPVNTTSGAITVTLPASPVAGNQITIIDYARTFGTNNCTINPNGNKIQSGTANAVLSTRGSAINLVYVDATQGWLTYAYTTATVPQPYSINWLLAAGGGSGGGMFGNSQADGGGGAGGLGIANSVSVTPGTIITATVGGGGAFSTNTRGANGSNSVLSFGAITETANGGGAGGGGSAAGLPGVNGGSGGGGGGSGSGSNVAGSATTGSGTYSTFYGNAGGAANTGSPYSAGGGGGASAAGAAGATLGGNGGAGLASSITGSSVTYAGGGGGGGGTSGNAGGSGGAGGGGTGGTSPTNNGTNGTANTGGGGGGGSGTNTSAGSNGGNGGSGVIIISVPTASYSGTTTGSPTITTSGSNTIITFTASGTYTT